MDKVHEDMEDRFGRRIYYLRISVTDRCNMRCRYCMPHGFSFLSHSDLMSYEQILKLAGLFIELGIQKIRITGGEPLIRNNIMFLIESLGQMRGLEELTLTTNGLKLGGYSRSLREAGVRRVNVSLDSLNRDTFKVITGMDLLDVVVNGIHKASSEGLSVKINVVALRGVNDGEFKDFIEFGIRYGCGIRFIEVMSTSLTSEYLSGSYMACDEIIESLNKDYHLIPLNEPGSTAVERLYGIEGHSIKVGFISPISKPFCSMCNRLRLTSEGILKTCLFGDDGPNLKELLDNGIPDEDIKRIIRREVYNKPLMYNLENCSSRVIMNRIGG
ncbi:MAG: GTP 3',8-cyclase MoaA [Spirochaetota bacterium]